MLYLKPPRTDYSKRTVPESTGGNCKTFFDTQLQGKRKEFSANIWTV